MIDLCTHTAPDGTPPRAARAMLDLHTHTHTHTAPDGTPPRAARAMIDLHTHATASDGTPAPAPAP